MGGFISKEYKDNSKYKMHWIGSYKTCLLIISNYTYHLHEKKITHHIIYIKKKKLYILTSKFIAGCEQLGYCNNKQHWYNGGLALHFMHALWKEGQTTIRIILVCKMWNKKKKKKSSYPKVRGTHVNYILSKYL